MSTNPYPEHAKIKAFEGANDVVGDFIEWVHSQPGITFASWRPHFCLRCREPWKVDDEGRCTTCEAGADAKSDDVLLPSYPSTTRLLARYFDIDLERLEIETRQMLAKIREASS